MYKFTVESTHSDWGRQMQTIVCKTLREAYAKRRAAKLRYGWAGPITKAQEQRPVAP